MPYFKFHFPPGRPLVLGPRQCKIMGELSRGGRSALFGEDRRILGSLEYKGLIAAVDGEFDLTDKGRSVIANRPNLFI